MEGNGCLLIGTAHSLQTPANSGDLARRSWASLVLPPSLNQGDSRGSSIGAVSLVGLAALLSARRRCVPLRKAAHRAGAVVCRALAPPGPAAVSLATTPSSEETAGDEAQELLKGLVPYTFEEVGLHPDLALALLDWEPESLDTATKIQATAIPQIIAGQDVVIQAETGAGKTLAYLLPAAHHAIEAYELERRLAQEEEQNKKSISVMEEDDDHRENSFDETEGFSSSSTAVAFEEEEEAQEAVCYRVTPYLGSEALRPQQAPQEYAPYLRKDIRFLAGDEFMVKRVQGSVQGTQFLELADGSGWIKWARDDPSKRLSLLGMSFEVGQRVVAKTQLQYRSGDVVEAGTPGIVRRVVPLVGVEWDGLPGVKAISKPCTQLGNLLAGGKKSKWAALAPDTLIVLPSRELCEQVAGEARKLRALLPAGVREKWTVGIAVGQPPGVGKKRKKNQEQWPFPRDRTPHVLVTTMEFIHWFNHRRQIPLWGNIRYAVYDEVDWLLNSQKGNRQMGSIRGMVLRAARTMGHHVQTVAVAATVPSAGGRSVFKTLRKWMPQAVAALPRPEYLHRATPLLQQEWRLTPESFEERVDILVEDLRTTCKQEKPPKYIPGTKTKWTRAAGRPDVCYRQTEKTIVFCHDPEVAAQLAEVLASTYHFLQVGLFIQDIGKEERRKRLKMFREGEVMIMVSSNLLQRGIDVPDTKHVVQFEFARNISDHLHRIGRASRGGNRGRVTNYYNDGFYGGRLLAEAIQDVGDQRLDALFNSRGTSLRKKFKAIEANRETRLAFGMELPEHLRDDGDGEYPEIPAISADDFLEAASNDEPGADERAEVPKDASKRKKDGKSTL